MNRKLISTLFLTVVMAAVMLSASAAKADLLLTLDNPNQGGSQGQTLNYFGTITSTSGTLSIFADACTPSGPTTCNDSPLFDLTPFDVVEGTPFHGLLFTITIDSNAAYGFYSGSFYIYGEDANQNVLNNEVDRENGNFSAAVPEPSSMLLLGSGLSGLVGVIRRKRQK
jgi:hypothetical protein